jgi:hypothetical protein
MTLMPEIHDALARAVGARPVRRRRRPSRRAGLLAVGVLVVSGSAVAATGGWRPILGDDDRGHPQPARATVPAAQVSALSVLRRAQTDRDRGPDVRSILRLLPRTGINGVQTDAIRLLRQREDRVTILVPAERVGSRKISPTSIRRRVLCVLTGVTTTRNATVKDRTGRPRTIRVPGGAGQVCGDLRQLRTTGIGASGTRTDKGFITGALVPDSVASVVIRLRNDRHRTANVHDNYYEINIGNELAPAWGARWLDAHGNTIDHRRTKHP